MKKFNLFTKMMHVCLIMFMLITMVGCGNSQPAEESVTGYVYVPSYIDMGIDEADWFSGVQVVGNELYTSYSAPSEDGLSYETKIVKKELVQGSEAVEIPIQFAPMTEGYQVSVNGFYIDNEANIYCVTYEYPIYDPENPEAYVDVVPVYAVHKYDKDGKPVYSTNISEQLAKDPNNSYINNIVVDGKGRTYLSSNNLVFVLDENGTFLCTLDTKAEWIRSFAVDKEGKIYVSQYAQNYNGLDLFYLDADNKTIGQAISGCPDSNSDGIYHAGLEKGILVSGNEFLYEFDAATGETVEVLNWIDCNVNGSNVRSVHVGKDNSIVAFTADYSSSKTQYEIVLLEKKPAGEVPVKKEITVATLYSNQNLQSAAVAFNKANNEYQVTLKTYIPDTAEWTETTYSDALNLLNADLTGANCPDIIDLSVFNPDNLVAKGLIEDLMPYLESSSVVSKEDFLENVLNSSTIDGVLTTIPTYVNLQGIIGRASQLEGIDGWTTDEFMAFADKYPDTKVFHYATKASMLNVFLNYSISDFVDYSTGECHFDSPDFIKVLEFCNRFELEYEYNEDESFPDMIQSGEILLADTGFYSMQEYQMYSLMFPEEIKVIGYPTVDGTGGIKLSSYNTYAMTTKSDNKEGAWAFLESTLGYEEYDEWRHNGFPTRKDMLEEMFTAASTPDYIYDENGEIMLDENGNKMENPKTSWGYDNWQADIYAATSEQIDAVRELINQGEMTGNMDQGLYEIIIEDAQPYFEGQKSAEEVAKIIQSRAMIYVSENM